MEKKETIEEFALRLYPEDIDDHNDNSMVEYDCNLPERLAFIEGAKCMAEQMFINKGKFNVATYSILDKNEIVCHWSKGLTMIIEKDGIAFKLNSEEIQEIVKSLPRTIGGTY